MTDKQENVYTNEVADCIGNLSGMLMNQQLNSDDTLTLITVIDKLATMLARWYHIR
jgi:hypothetical protein